MAHNLTRRTDGTHEFVEATHGGSHQAWHGLGERNDGDALSADEALAPLDWEVKQAPLIVGEYVPRLDEFGNPILDGNGEPVMRLQPRTGDDGKIELADRWLLNEREDTGERFQVVGKDWTPVQNHQLIELAKRAAGDSDLGFESAFSMKGGRYVCLTAELGRFEVLGDDISRTYAVLSNSHDGTGSLQICSSDIRTICDNTRNASIGAAEAEDRLLNISLRHTRNVLSEDNIEKIREALVKQGDAVQRHAVQAEALAARELSPDELRAFFLEAYRLAVGFPKRPEGSSDPRAVRKFERATERLQKTVAGWLATQGQEAERFGVDTSKQRGNAWLAYNAVSKWSDHDRRAKDRQHSNLVGASAQFKSKVYAGALELVGTDGQPVSDAVDIPDFLPEL